MRLRAPGRRILVLTVVALLIPFMMPAGDARAKEGQAEKQAIPTGGATAMSMEQWRETREAANAAMEAPRGDEKIASLEAFVKEHPGYPEQGWVLQSLVETYIDKGDFNPAHLASLLEQITTTETLYVNRKPEFLVTRYYFKHHLPMESAERLLAKARSEIADDRLKLSWETLPKKREEARDRLEFREFQLGLCEGRVLLEKRNYPAALEKLKQTEQLGDLSGRSGLLLQDSMGKTIRRFPTGGSDFDWLHLSLATAFLKTGNRREARARLDLVQNFSSSFYPEVAIEREALRKELGMPRASAGREFRAPPKRAADFTLKDLEGKEVALSDFPNRVVLAMFWATW
jgi:hypothetical protein